MSNTTASAFPSYIRAAGKTPAQWFPLRRVELLEAAEATLSAVSTIARDDQTLAAELMDSVRAMLAEVAQIDGLR